MESRAQTAPSFNGARDDVSASSGWVALVLVLFSKARSESRLLVRSFGVGRHGMTYGCIEYVFGG